MNRKFENQLYIYINSHSGIKNISDNEDDNCEGDKNKKNTKAIMMMSGKGDYHSLFGQLPQFLLSAHPF